MPRMHVPAAFLVVPLMTAFVPPADGGRLDTADREPTAEKASEAAGQPARTFKKGLSRIYDLAYSPDGKWIAIACAAYVVKDETQPGLRIWNSASGDVLPLVKEETPWTYALCFSPDSRRLAFGHAEDIRVWDIVARKESLRLKRVSDAYCLAFSPDGKLVASGGGYYAGRPDEVKLWDANSGKELLRLKGHTELVRSVAFSPDGRRLVSGSADGSARVWDRRTGREIGTFSGFKDGIRRVLFIRDGKQLLIASGARSPSAEIKIVDAASLKGR